MTATRIAMVPKTSSTTDLRAIRIGRAPREASVTFPDLRKETAPRRCSVKPFVPKLSKSERIEMLKRAIADVAAEERDYGC